MTTEGEKSLVDTGKGTHQHPSANANDQMPGPADVEAQSWHSPCSSNLAASSVDEFRLSVRSETEISGVLEPYSRKSCVSDCSLEVGSDTMTPEIKINLAKVEKDCRICHLSLENVQETGMPIELGCSCKDDLAAVHKQCAEAWFKIKGNNICEICGSTAKNVLDTIETVLVEQSDESGSSPPTQPPREARRFWHGHRFLNFLLACVVFAFVVSWLFHFNIPH